MLSCSFWAYKCKKKYLDDIVEAYRKNINSTEDAIEQTDALLRFYFKVDPEELSDEKYYRLVAQLEWIVSKRLINNGI